MLLVSGAAASAMRGRSSPMALRSGASERVRSSAAEAAARRAARHRSCGDTEHRAPRWRCATLFTAPSAATPPLPASSAAHPPHRYLILPTRAPSARLPSSPPPSPGLPPRYGGWQPGGAPRDAVLYARRDGAARPSAPVRGATRCRPPPFLHPSPPPLPHHPRRCCPSRRRSTLSDGVVLVSSRRQQQQQQQQQHGEQQQQQQQQQQQHGEQQQQDAANAARGPHHHHGQGSSQAIARTSSSGWRHPQEAANLLIPTTCRRCATVSPPSHSVGPCWVQRGGAPTITFIYR